ncbi:MAG TPA: hypothetical protein VHD15_08405, partial [Hyphomicrobiales bacterium]|nr:hypothetical protein [Hyphomicrobiales bacterium]
ERAEVSSSKVTGMSHPQKTLLNRQDPHVPVARDGQVAAVGRERQHHSAYAAVVDFDREWEKALGPKTNLAF